jgi:hypothetical protein
MKPKPDPSHKNQAQPTSTWLFKKLSTSSLPTYLPTTIERYFLLRRKTHSNLEASEKIENAAIVELDSGWRSPIETRAGICSEVERSLKIVNFI